MTRVAVLDDWQDVARDFADWSPLEARAQVTFFPDAFPSEEAAAATLRDFDILLSMRERLPLPGSLIRRLPRLRLLAITGSQNRSLDLGACTQQGVVVCRTEGGTGAEAATAELALGLLIACARAIPAGDAAIRAGGFQRGVPVGMTLAGRTLGIIGLGKLGSAMARYGLALGMDVIAWSPNLTAERAEAQGVRLAGKEDLLREADAISLHMVLSDRSRGMIGAAELALMKPGAILINTSRGPLVDEAALLTALREGRIRAGLDVFDQEPLPAGHELRRLPGTVLTPHLGYGVALTWRQFYPQSVENALAFLDGEPIRVLNPAALGRVG